jgi:hypothetical protein
MCDAAPPVLVCISMAGSEAQWDISYRGRLTESHFVGRHVAADYRGSAACIPELEGAEHDVGNI